MKNLFYIMFSAGFLYEWAIFAEEKNRSNIFHLIAAIMFIMVAGIFKPISLLLILVLVVTEVINMLTIGYNFHEKHKQYVVISLLTILISYAFMSNFPKWVLEQYIETDVVQATPYYILWGYSVDEYGNWDNNIDDTIAKAYRGKQTISQAMSELGVVAKQTVIKNIKYLPKIYYQKARMLFYGEGWPLIWSATNEKSSFAVWIGTNNGVLSNILAFFNVITILMMPFSLFRKNKVTNLLAVWWIGYILYLICGSGVQGRYRILAVIPQILLAVEGGSQLYFFVQKHKIIYRRKINDTNRERL